MTSLPKTACAALLLTSACVSTGEVREVSSAASFSEYKTARVHVRAMDGSVKNSALQVRTCAQELPAELTKREVFDSMLSDDSPNPPDLLLKAVILGSEDTVRFGPMIREDQGVVLEVTAIDTAQSSTVAKVLVSGNSKSNVDVGFAGISANNLSDQFRKACRRAGEHLAEYLKLRR